MNVWRYEEWAGNLRMSRATGTVPEPFHCDHIARWSARSGTTGRSGTGVNTGARLRSGTVPVPNVWCEHGLRRWIVLRKLPGTPLQPSYSLATAYDGVQMRRVTLQNSCVSPRMGCLEWNYLRLQKQSLYQVSAPDKLDKKSQFVFWYQLINYQVIRQNSPSFEIIIKTCFWLTLTVSLSFYSDTLEPFRDLGNVG